MTKPIFSKVLKEIYEIIMNKIYTLENECEKLKYDNSMINRKKLVDDELYNLHQIRRAFEKLDHSNNSVLE